MRYLSIKRVPDRCFWAALLFCTIYQSYRYPLQLNASGTSPTYADTPAAFQAGKFVVVLALCSVAFLYIRKRKFPFRRWFLAILITGMSCYATFKAIGADSGSVSEFIGSAFWPLAALTLVLATSPLTINALDRYFRFVFYYALLSTALEVLLFATIGRLPALAYANSFSVRFGGFLDDPNGFAALLFMLMGWTHFKFTGSQRGAAQISLIICVLLTQSFTAIGFLVVLGLLALGKMFLRKPLIATLTAISIVALLGYAWTLVADLVPLVMATRSGSVDDHLVQITGTKSRSGLDVLFGGSSYTSYESWWVGSFVNFGLFWYVLSLGVIVTLLIYVLRAFRRAHDSRHKAVLSGILSLACYFFVGCLNLPLFIIFPINFLFFLFACLVFFNKIEGEILHTAELPVAI